VANFEVIAWDEPASGVLDYRGRPVWNNWNKCRFSKKITVFQSPMRCDHWWAWQKRTGHSQPDRGEDE